MDLDAIDGTSSSEESPKPPRRGIKRDRGFNALTVGTLACYLIVASLHGLHSAVKVGEDDIEARDLLTDGQNRLVCVVLGRWSMVAADAVTRDRQFLDLESSRATRCRHPTLGFMKWEVVDVFVPTNLWTIPPGLGKLAIQAQTLAVRGRSAEFENVPFSEVRRSWSGHHDLPLLNMILVYAGCAVAWNVSQRRWNVFNLIPLHQNIRGRFMAFEDKIAKRHLKAWLETCAEPEQVIGRRRVRWWAKQVLPGYRQRSVEEVVEWLHAARTLSSLRAKSISMTAWGAIFDRAHKVPRGTTVAPVVEMGYNVLRRARVRLDIACMLLHRIWWESLSKLDPGPCVYIYTDTSPQWRRRELHASSFEYWLGNNMLCRRLFPLISLGKTMLKTIGKTFSLLWQVFLHVGPSYEKLELFTRSVVSMTVDFGVESLIPGMPDMLGAFCVYCKIPVPKVGVHRRASTFPRCVVSPGWHHIWDGLTKRGLESTYWFPLFLKQTKLVQSFLRNNMTEMVDELERHGKTSVSALLQSVRLENFAKWRWNTLRRVVSELRSLQL